MLVRENFGGVFNIQLCCEEKIVVVCVPIEEVLGDSYPALLKKGRVLTKFIFSHVGEFVSHYLQFYREHLKVVFLHSDKYLAELDISVIFDELRNQVRNQEVEEKEETQYFEHCTQCLLLTNEKEKEHSCKYT